MARQGGILKFTDTELFVAMERAKGNQAEAARELGVSRAAVNMRLKGHNGSAHSFESSKLHPQRIDINVQEGVVLVGSDAHIWPGELSTAFRAFVWACKQLSPELVVLNGDVYDGAKISRFPSIGWEKKPTPMQEIEACQAALTLIEAPRKIWTFGNHDWRFESYIAKNADQLVGLQGVHLKDYFPFWENAWRLRINGHTSFEVNIKHRSGGGSPLARGRLAGTSLVTGHLHSMNCTRFTNYSGDHFSIDSGTLARVPGEIEVPQFTPYVEDGPVDWAAGFVVLTFHEGRLLWPEFVHVIDELAGLFSFRGEVFHA
jgi:hypothetical protein